MKAFIEYVVKALVDYPDQVDIREVEAERVVVYELRLEPTDVGKVIGKNGRTIMAIRTLLSGAAGKHGKRAMLEIIEPAGGRRGGGRPPTAAADAEPGPAGTDGN